MKYLALLLGTSIVRLFSSVIEETLAKRVKYLEAKGFDAIPKELCIAAYSYTIKCSIEILSI